MISGGHFDLNVERMRLRERLKLVWSWHADWADMFNRGNISCYMDSQKARQDQMKVKDAMNERRKYVDVTTYSRSKISSLLHVADKKPILLYMPYLDFKGMEWLEAKAKESGTQLLNIPITLPVMDIVKQSEYAGIEITSDFVLMIMNGMRDLITDTLNKEA